MNRPLGINLLIVYFLLGILGIVYALTTMFEQSTSFAPAPFLGVFDIPIQATTLIAIITAGIYAACAYGLFKAKKYALNLTLAVMAYGLITSITSIFTAAKITEYTIKVLEASGETTPSAAETISLVMTPLMQIAFLFGAIISIAIAYYIWKKKDYFTEEGFWQAHETKIEATTLTQTKSQQEKQDAPKQARKTTKTQAAKSKAKKQAKTTTKKIKPTKKH